MGAETKYYAMVPRIEYDLIECYGVTQQDIFDKFPIAFDVFHADDEDKLKEYSSYANVRFGVHYE